MCICNPACDQFLQAYENAMHCETLPILSQVSLHKQAVVLMPYVKLDIFPFANEWHISGGL